MVKTLFKSVLLIAFFSNNANSGLIDSVANFFGFSSQEMVGYMKWERFIRPNFSTTNSTKKEHEQSWKDCLEDNNCTPIYASTQGGGKYLTWLSYDDYVAGHSEWFSGSMIYSDMGGGWRVLTS